MKDEYVIYESKLNHMTDEQLAKLKPNSILPVARYLSSIEINNNKALQCHLNHLADTISVLHEINSSEGLKSAYVSFDKTTLRYKLRIMSGGRLRHIVSSRDKNEVLKAKKIYCDELGIKD